MSSHWTQPLSLLGVGVLGPGLANWAETRAVLSGRAPYVEVPTPAPPPAGLPPNERRRSTLPTRVGLEVARQALTGLDLDRVTLASVFASSDGDMDLIDRLCTDIYRDRVPVSPTLFHNSVHNAVAGYWSIAAGCRGPSTSLAAWDGSLAAGLLESAVQVAATDRPVLLVAYDLPATGCLGPHRPFAAPFGCALVLGAPIHGVAPPLATLRLGFLDASGTAEGWAPGLAPAPALETLRAGNPAARVLPLLRLVATGTTGTLRLPYLYDLDLAVSVS